MFSPPVSSSSSEHQSALTFVTGAQAHRLGGSSFPKLRGTKPLAETLRPVEGEHPNLITGVDAVKCHQKVFRQRNADEKNTRAAMAKEFADHCSHNPAPILSYSRTLREVGTWETLPGHCQSCNLVFDAQELCKVEAESSNIAGLAKAWKQRPAKKRVAGL